ncbi:MAG: hypothetical protein AAFU55_13050, partial [Pseudomonadota bacterium]
IDIECLGIWPGAWDLTSASERAKFFDTASFAPAMNGDGVIDGVAPSVFLWGGPGDWLAEFGSGEMRVANKGTIPGPAFVQSPLADASLAGFASAP